MVLFLEIILTSLLFFAFSFNCFKFKSITGIPLQYGLSINGKFGAHKSNQSDREVTAIPRIVWIAANVLDSLRRRRSGGRDFLGTVEKYFLDD